VDVLEEDRLQVIFIRLEDLEVRPGSQFRQFEFEEGFGPRGRMPGSGVLYGCQENRILVAAICGLGLAVVAVMMDPGQRRCPRLGELGVAQLLPLVEAWTEESA